mmetsp:Transcript_1798/g.4165  ORF Transcript_1798/g.4165 Transcript_1798/m.4165 type:complete len:243 (-) Transcript_1798:572-1300(-)
MRTSRSSHSTPATSLSTASSDTTPIMRPIESQRKNKHSFSFFLKIHTIMIQIQQKAPPMLALHRVVRLGYFFRCLGHRLFFFLLCLDCFPSPSLSLSDSAFSSAAKFHRWHKSPSMPARTRSPSTLKVRIVRPSPGDRSITVFAFMLPLDAARMSYSPTPLPAPLKPQRSFHSSISRPVQATEPPAGERRTSSATRQEQHLRLLRRSYKFTIPLPAEARRFPLLARHLDRWPVPGHTSTGYP